jgi:FkbM family methyltransferase
MVRKLLEALSNIYAATFCRPPFSRLNNIFLNWCLKARGFNNYKSGNSSGENFFIKEILSKENPEVCIDIGANVGNFTLLLLKETNSTVYSFEPLPNPFRELTLRTSRFGERSICVNKGVGEANSMLTIHYSDESTTHASFSAEVKGVPYVSNEKSECIEVVSLDSFLSNIEIPSVDFIKIDTEGFEFEVIKGALRTVEKFKPKFIQIEFNWHQLFRQNNLYTFACILKDYDLYQLLPNGWIKRDPIDPLCNIYFFSNFVFKRRMRSTM